MHTPNGWFKALYDSNHRKLLWLAGNITGDMDAASIIVSEAFIKVWKQQDVLLQNGQELGGFLHTCVKNASIDLLRMKRRSLVEYQDADELKRVTAEQDAQLVSTEVITTLYEAILQLPQQQREVIQRLYLEEKHKSQVAKELGIRVNTVETHRDRGIKALREKLGEINFKKWFDL